MSHDDDWVAYDILVVHILPRTVFHKFQKDRMVQSRRCYPYDPYGGHDPSWQHETSRESAVGIGGEAELVEMHPSMRHQHVGGKHLDPEILLHELLLEQFEEKEEAPVS